MSSRLKIGWFYGNENEDYAIYAAEIIEKLAAELHIKNSNIILYGSSAGGTAAIRVGAHLKGSKVAAVNPQLDICHWNSTKHFVDITGIDLLKEDIFDRNNMSSLMLQSTETEYLLIMNAGSRNDIEVQLDSFIARPDCDFRPVYGLSKYKNITFWIYDGPGKMPHTVQEDYRIYAYIRYLLEKSGEENFVQKHKYEVLYINDWWRGQAQTKNDLQILKEENQRLKKQRESFYKERLGGFYSSNTQFQENITARIDIINHSGNQSDISTDIKWLEISDDAAKVQAPLFYLRDGQGYVLQSDKGQIRFRFRCIGSGMLEFTLRGIFKQDSNKKHIPCWIDYTAFSVNRYIIFNERKSAWHDKPYRFSLKVSDGDVIEGKVLWEKHIN